LETKFEMILLAPVAWVELEDIDLLFHDNVLTIKWIRKKPDIYSSGIVLRNSECFWWEFKRNIILPENLDFEAIKASLENNLLLITIPKLKFSNQSIKIERKD
jgi:HSP20 family molecular chaperone IbpA